jgi:endoglycosylceramidase
MPGYMRAVLLAAALSAVAAAPAAAAPTGPLSNVGRWVTDAEGRVVILHGVNMVYKRPPYAPDAIGFGDDDAAFLASEGYDTVRVGIIYKALEPQPGVYDDAYLDRIAQTVATLGRHGINSMLDFHQDMYNERFQGEGWPDWAVQDDGLPAEPKMGFSNNYLFMPALQHAFDHFWNNDPGPGGVGLQDSYAAAWRHVAERFRGNPDVLGYEVMNEPWPGSTWQTCANPAGCPVFDATLTAFVKRVIAAIRTADPAGLVWFEPNVIFNDGADTNLGDPGDKHVGFAFHDYCLIGGAFFKGGDPGPGQECDTFDDLVFANAEKYSQKTGAALLMTEFGATTDTGVLRKMADRSDLAMVGWQEWHYCGCDDPTTAGPGDTQALVLDPRKPPTGDNLDTSKLGALSRPYPQVVAGTPKAFGFDAQSKTFTLRYTTARAGGGKLAPGAETEIAVPARQYPTGYALEVRGANARYRPGDGMVRMTNCPGTTEVSVKITPGNGVSDTCALPAGVGTRPPGRGTRPALGLTVRPRRATAGRTTRFRFQVRGASGATIRFGGKRRRTDRRGKASLRVRFRHPGRRFARATARGAKTARVSVRIVRAR